MRCIIYVFVGAALAAGCVSSPEGDDAADAAAETAPALDKADAPSFDGLYQSSATSLRSGDVPTVELRAGTYIRARCYHAYCAKLVPETDKFDLVKSSGHWYVRFWSFTITTDANGDRNPNPVVADVYEIRRTSTGVKLRKTYTTRWVSLDKVTTEDQCDGSGGTWSGDCACPDAGAAVDTHGVFVPGAGGCIDIGGGGEDACDSSGGLYTDDDSTPIGTYCECGLGRYVAPGPGECAKI